MTEVPEHLLRRSRERREALGLSTGGEGAPAGESAAPEPAAAGGGGDAPPPAEAAPPVPAPEPEPAAPPPPPPEYIQASERRSRIPYWAMPVLALLPLWAFVYAGTLELNEAEATGPLGLGAEVYGRCASCHGGGGGGGVGPQLSNGEVVKTFPNIEDHLEFVRNGSAPIQGQPYGDPDREGGQRVAETGGMPAWDTLSEEELRAVILHERVTLGGEQLTPEEMDAFMAGEGGGGEAGGGDAGDTSPTTQPSGG